MSTLLVLSAAVNPGEPASVVRADPAVRQADYLESLRRWIEVSEARFPLEILFCDNSGWPLEEMARSARQYASRTRVDFVQLGPTGLGKGVGEAMIVDHVIQSELPERDVDFVVKCTGRLFVKNCLPALRRLGQDVDLMCALDAQLRFADSRFFVARKEVFSTRLAGLGPEIDDSRHVYFEHALLRRALGAVADGARWVPFPSPLLFVGRSATDGTKYDGPREQIEWIARAGLRKAVRYTRMQF